MRAKRTIRRKRATGRKTGRANKGATATTSDGALSRRLSELTERIDVVLPEVTARVAALEHLLLDLKLCTMADLRRAREFVRMQEA